MSGVRLAIIWLLVASWGAGALAQQVPQQNPHKRPTFDRRSFGTPPEIPATRPEDSELTEEELAVVKHFRELGLEPGASFSEFLEKWLEPMEYKADRVIKIDDKYAYSHPSMSVKLEIVKEDGDSIWLRRLPPENPDSPLFSIWNRIQVYELFFEDRKDRGNNDYFLDFSADIIPPPFVDGLRFEAVTSGLPVGGKWQMNFAIADMNEDGVPDLVFPPQRLGRPQPTILLGEGGGRFSFWKDAAWTNRVPFDYGAVAVADFNGDGHQDLAIAIHFKEQYVIYGDGKGQFGRADRLPRPDARITSRAVTTGDFNGDGLMDLAFVAEINYEPGSNVKLDQSSTVWVVLNQGDEKWQLQQDGLPQGKLISDKLMAADISRDGRTDLVLGSNTSGWRPLVYVNDAEDGWQPAEMFGVLSNSYHFDVALGTGQPENRLYATFAQFQRYEGHNQARSGIVIYPWSKKGLIHQGVPIVLDDDRNDVYYRIAVGDLNGDGLDDIVAGRKPGAIEIYLQISPDTYYLEQSPEIESPGRVFDIQLVDLDGDGRDDIVASFVSTDDLPGGVRVWLTRPAA